MTDTIIKLAKNLDAAQPLDCEDKVFVPHFIVTNLFQSLLNNKHSNRYIHLNNYIINVVNS